MKKNYFLGALFMLSSLAYSQKTIFVNGGQFGNQSENANVMVYDPVVDSSRVIDTIHSQSVQEILFDGNSAYVLAQDSLVKYDLLNEVRLVGQKFMGLSTKSVAISGQELLVGNFYGQSTNNLVIYDKNTLALTDTVLNMTKAVKSILVNNGFAFIPQNAQTSGFSDTSGYILKFNIATRTVTDTIRVSGYTGDFGQLILNKDETGFLSLNPVSNTITGVDFTTLSATNTSIGVNFSAGGQSNYSRYRDTLFIKTGNGISAIDLGNLAVTDTNFIDTVITGFSYDTLNARFYVTQTDFFSYKLGKSYNRQGVKLKDIEVGYSPEVVRIYYGNALAVEENNRPKVNFDIFPNPTTEYFSIKEDIKGELDLVLFNVNGQLLKVWIQSSENRYFIGDLPKGTYFLSINKGDERITERLIIQ